MDITPTKHQRSYKSWTECRYDLFIVQQAHLEVFVLFHTPCTADIYDYTYDKLYFVPVCLVRSTYHRFVLMPFHVTISASAKYVVLGQTGIPSDQSRCQAYSLRSYVDQAYPEDFASPKDYKDC